MKKYTIAFFILLTGCQKQPKQMPQKSLSIKKTLQRPRKQPTPPPGLKTKLLIKGKKNAPFPEFGDMVLVHYTGWIAQEDGKPGRQIDSSIERNEPLKFTVGLSQVIKGFEEGVKQMKLGEKRRLFIDSELGYGKKGIGLFIPPDANLIFDVELLGIKKPE